MYEYDTDDDDDDDDDIDDEDEEEDDPSEEEVVVTYSPIGPFTPDLAWDPVSTAAPVVVRSLLTGFLSLVSSIDTVS